MRHVTDEVRTHSIEVDFDDLLTTVYGVQGAITIHEILPAGWEVKEVEVETVVAFNGAGTRSLLVGIPTDTDAIVAAGLDVKAAAVKTVTTIPYRSTAPVAIVAVLTTGTDNPTAGQMLITLHLVHVAMEN